jgi:hypothetical protein
MLVIMRQTHSSGTEPALLHRSKAVQIPWRRREHIPPPRRLPISEARRRAAPIRGNFGSIKRAAYEIQWFTENLVRRFFHGFWIG